GLEPVGRIVFRFSVLVFRKDFFVCKFRIARIGHYEVCKVQYLLKRPRRYVENKPHSRRDPLEIPYMGNRRGQLYMAHPFPSHLGLRYFDSALVAYYALVSYPLVFSAVAFPVLCRSEYP